MLNKSEQAKYKRLITESKQLLRTFQMPIARSIKWDTMNSNRTWGTCSQQDNSRKFIIKINEQLIIKGSDKAIKQTIIHELLHTCPDCMKHTGAWKRHANFISAHTDYIIERCTSAKDKGFEEFPSNVQSKYKVTCKCGTTWNYSRMNRVVKTIQAGRDLKCPVCKYVGKFDLTYKRA